MIVMVVGVFGLCGGVFRLAAAAMLSFAVAVVAAASAFGVMMFLMIMVLLVVHNVPLRAVKRVCSADSTPQVNSRVKRRMRIIANGVRVYKGVFIQ